MSFPNSIGAGEYSIVRMKVIPNYGNWELRNQEYVFVFQTMIRPRGGEKDHSMVNIEIVDKEDLPIFNPYVKEAGKFEYNGGSMAVNDYIEIVEEKNEFQTRYIAILRKQLTLDDKGDPTFISDKYILLLSDNRSGVKHFKNSPIVEFGPQFQAYIHYLQSEKKYDQMEDALRQIRSLEGEEGEVEGTIELLRAKVKEQKLKSEEWLGRYLDIERKVKSFS